MIMYSLHRRDITSGGGKTMALPQTFKAMVVSETTEQKFIREIKEKDLSDLPAGELLIEVKYSSLNYEL
jgi:hypothetical protein